MPCDEQFKKLKQAEVSDSLTYRWTSFQDKIFSWRIDTKNHYHLNKVKQDSEAQEHWRDFI